MVQRNTRREGVFVGVCMGGGVRELREQECERGRRCHKVGVVSKIEVKATSAPPRFIGGCNGLRWSFGSLK